MQHIAAQILDLVYGCLAEETLPGVEQVTVYARTTRLMIARLERRGDRERVANRACVVIVADHFGLR